MHQEIACFDWILRCAPEARRPKRSALSTVSGRLCDGDGTPPGRLSVGRKPGGSYERTGAPAFGACAGEELLMRQLGLTIALGALVGCSGAGGGDLFLPSLGYALDGSVGQEVDAGPDPTSGPTPATPDPTTGQHHPRPPPDSPDATTADAGTRPRRRRGPRRVAARRPARRVWAKRMQRRLPGLLPLVERRARRPVRLHPRRPVQRHAAPVRRPGGLRSPRLSRHRLLRDLARRPRGQRRLPAQRCDVRGSATQIQCSASGPCPSGGSCTAGAGAFGGGACTND